MSEKTKTQSHSIDELNRLYSEGESCDKELFSEQRSNILLSAGDHFSKKNGQFWSRIRDSKTIPQDQKLRITKNHTYKIVRTYINNLLSMAPGVKAMPQDPKDLRHTKAAELSQAVWDYAKKTQDYKSKIASCAKNFIECGEVFVEVVFDPNKGRMVGYEQEVDDDGFPLFTNAAGDQTPDSHDEFGQPHEPMASSNAVFTGELVSNLILPGNVIRAAEAKTIKESRFLCLRDMVHISDLKKMVGDDEDKLKMITEHQDDTFIVFDGQKNNYGNSKNQAVVRKFYFRPSIEYPNGYYYICTKEGILFEGELPFGIFPIIYGGFDEISTTPRHRSIIKQLRPLQSEINRAASKIAETQITLGDDKIILQNGSKVTAGPQLPGIRTMSVTGQAPTIMSGRAGDQYLPYLAAQIAELYQVANIVEDSQETPGQDPWANLFRSVREKKKFSIYSEKFERFLVEWFECFISLAKEYYDENMLIPAIGKSEVINIAEFKNQEPLFTRITAEPMSDDINTMMGKTLVMNHILQYVGPQLQKDDIGKILRQMPFANSDEAFDEFTLDYDTATNIVLALDRGEQVQPQKWDNGQYILKILAARQKKADFRLLDPQIQNNYAMLIQAYEQIEAKKAQDLKAAQSQFIPSGGAMIKVAYYVKDPTNPDRSIQATVPAEAVDWLINQLATQGSAQEQLMQQGPGVRDDLANMISAGGIPPRQLMPSMQQAGGAPQPNMSAQAQTPGSPAWLAMRGAGAR